MNIIITQKYSDKVPKYSDTLMSLIKNTILETNCPKILKSPFYLLMYAGLGADCVAFALCCRCLLWPLYPNIQGIYHGNSQNLLRRNTVNTVNILDRQARANSVDPDKTLQNVASHQGVQSLPRIQQFLNTTSGSKLYLFKFKNKYGKEFWALLFKVSLAKRAH